MLLANDLAGDKVMANPCACSCPGNCENSETRFPWPISCVCITSAMAKSQAPTMPFCQAMPSLGGSNKPQHSRQNNNKDIASAAVCAPEKGLSSEMVAAKSVA